MEDGVSRIETRVKIDDALRRRPSPILRRAAPVGTGDDIPVVIWRRERACSRSKRGKRRLLRVFLDPDGWHVTLAFLGSIEAASVPQFVARLALVAKKHSAMSVRTGGLGAFPTPDRVRVVWYGIEDELGRLAELAHDIAAALDLDASQPFRPHLTLARARRPVDLRSWLASASVPEGVLEVDRVELMRSHVSGGPARCDTLATVTLGVTACV